MKYCHFYTYLLNVPGHTKVHKNSYRGNLNRLRKNISDDNINIYTRTTDAHDTPLFLAISNEKIDISDILLDIYECDLQFIANSIVQCNSKFWLHIPILIGFGDDDIDMVQKLYQEYRDVETSDIDSAKCTVVLLKRDNFTPVQVICLSPQTDQGKQIALKIVNRVIENGRLDLKGHNSRNESFLNASIATGLVTIFNRLCDLGAQPNTIELFIAAMHFGRMDMLEMLYNRYAVKMSDVIENKTFGTSLFAGEDVKVPKFVFEKYMAQNEFITWEYIVNLQLEPFGYTVFEQAIKYSRFEFAEFCLQHKPDLYKPGPHDYLPIQHIIKSDEQTKVLINRLLEMDRDLFMNRNVIQHMVQCNSIEVIVEIFDAHPNAKTTFFQNRDSVLTAFDSILNFGYFEMAELLIIHGQNYLEDATTITSILRGAIYKNRIDLVKTIFNIFEPILNNCPTNLMMLIISALSQHHLHIYNFIVEQTNFDLRNVIHNGANLLHYVIWSKLPRYDADMPGSLWSSLYEIPVDSEDEEDQELGLLPTFQRPDENFSDPYQITDDDIAENERFNRLFDEFIELGIDFRNTCSLNNTLLHRAVEANNLYVTKRLLELGADLNVYNSGGCQPIHCTTNLEIFQTLNSWTTKSFVNSRNSVTGETPLHRSVQLTPDKIELARYILEHNGDVNAIDNQGRAPIFKVSFIEYAELLLAHQANVNITDIFGNTPIHWGIMHYNPKIVMLLFEQPNFDYCAVNNIGTSYLEKFATYHTDIREKPTQVFKQIYTLDNPDFKRLLEIHCNTRTEFGTTVIGIPGVHNDDVMFDILLTPPHIDLDVRENQTGNTPLHIAAECGNARNFHKLIERGIPIDILNDNDDTPLNLCCQNSLDMVGKIMQHKPDVNIRNKCGMTPILNAAQQMRNDRACSEILVAGGNIFDEDAEGNSAYSMMSDEMKQIFVFLT